MIDFEVTLGYAIDRYLGELSRRGRTPATQRTYERVLNQFANTLPVEWDVSDVTPDQCRAFLDKWRQASASTRALYVSVLRGFFGFLADEGKVKHNPMDRIRRPPRPRPEDVDVVTVTSADVRAMLQAARSWNERLCISILAYMGPRRGALAKLRRSDVDFTHGTIRFQEKGGKIIVKPIPDALRSLLEDAEHDGLWEHASDYLIPNWRTADTRERDDRIVYYIVKKVADRAGVNAHAHALRAAFAVYYLETHEGDIEALRDLMGHSRYETTSVYLRKLNRLRSMERVRDLNWGVSLHGNPVVPPAGFEPALRAKPASKPKVRGAKDFTHFGFDLKRSLERILA